MLEQLNKLVWSAGLCRLSEDKAAEIYLKNACLTWWFRRESADDVEFEFTRDVSTESVTLWGWQIRQSIAEAVTHGVSIKTIGYTTPVAKR